MLKWWIARQKCEYFYYKINKSEGLIKKICVINFIINSFSRNERWFIWKILCEIMEYICYYVNG